MFYTYILQSVNHSDQFYRGHTADLRQRLVDHNHGRCPHTAKALPWKIRFYAAFETLEQAQPVPTTQSEGGLVHTKTRATFANTKTAKPLRP